MAFSRISMVSTVIVLLVFLFSHQPSTFVRADDELIRRVCHNSDAPTACNQCVKADNRTSVYQDDFAANGTITQCREELSYAKADLDAAIQDLKNGDYDASDKSVFNALLYQNSCESELKNNPKIRITYHINFGFNMYEALSHIALRIINRL
ncbi:hypothetical protein MKW94_023294 [Papaver nudicaule]|uniref:Pectinesterase inhibitor domain-containing protein n=1 Tax=Papaver nudicaule TaxID=74823 RepID=A0AA41RYJ3_PAPNU|nr:hypothetical protein [Papaver nudicaule]MCL7033003.1 hypothetical protein [Papaver nudicaule]